MKQFEENLANLNRDIKQNPDNAWALAHRGETYRLMERYQEALMDFNRCIELDSTYAWAIARRGETYRLMEDYDKALADFSRAIELTPTYAWAIAHRGATYRFMGKCYYDKALADFNRAIELTPTYAWALAYRALIHELLNRYEETLADFDRALALDDTLFNNPLSKRGLLLSYCGRYAEAIACCQQALLENPDDHFALYNVAVFKACWQGLAEARADVRKAHAALLSVVNTEARGIALYRLGGLAALEGRTEQALNYLEEAILLENETIEYACHDLAWLDLRSEPRFQSLIAVR